MYRPPQAGISAQELLEEQIIATGYHQSKLSQGYWTHNWCPTCSALVVDNVKNINKDDVTHLLEVLQKDYNMDTD
jgi:hypothetical protein